MRKFLILSVLASAMFVSCSVPTKLTNTASYNKMKAIDPFATTVFADLDVSPNKISFFYIPSQTVVSAGPENVVNSAIREALLANGNADVLVALENQIKYSSNGSIESITVTGYPAKYVNFRTPQEKDKIFVELLKITGTNNKKSATPVVGGGSFLDKLLGK